MPDLPGTLVSYLQFFPCETSLGSGVHTFPLNSHNPLRSFTVKVNHIGPAFLLMTSRGLGVASDSIPLQAPYSLIVAV